MAGEIQNKNIDQHSHTASSTETSSISETLSLSQTPQTESAVTTTTRSPHRAGALLVESYGKLYLAGNKISVVAPQKVLLEYTKYLLSSINSHNNNRQAAKDAKELLDTTELAIQTKAVQKWEPSLLQSVSQLLETHPSLSKQRAEIKATVAKLNTTQFEATTTKPTTPATTTTSTAPVVDDMSSLISGIADRMSFSDPATSNGISYILAELGPACTRSTATLREVLRDVAQTSGPLNEAALASLIFFFSDKTNSGDTPAGGLSSAMLGSIVSGRPTEGTGGWNLEVVAQVIREDYASRDWPAVAKHWDTADFSIKNANQFRTLLDMYRAGAKSTPPLAAFTAQWRHAAGQLSVFEAMMAVPPSVFMVPLDEEELADAATAPPPGPDSAPNPQCWASMEILQRLLHLSDVPSLYRRARDLFVRCLLTCPEVLFCSLVRLQLRVANATSLQSGGENLVSAGMQIKTELMRELIPLFFRPSAHHRVRNAPAALRRLYAISPSTVMAACFEAWRSTVQDTIQVRLGGIIHIINIARLLPSPADAVASLLSGNKDAEYSIAIAFIMADNDYLQLKPWLGEKLSSKGSVGAFAVALVSYLRKLNSTAKPRGGGVEGPLVSLENMVISLQLLQNIDPTVLSQTVTGSDQNLANGTTLGDNVRALVDACLAFHPALRASVSQTLAKPASQTGPLPPPNASDDVEEMATAYFQKIYTSENSIGEVVEMLRRFKNSGNSKENEIFACMVHNLFDEYRFFAKYPEKELRITGILFGALIQEQLVTSITLGIALRYVLEALRKPPSPPGSSTSSGKMFKFGMFALEQFKSRLHEWPQYCMHIFQIPHLKEGYAELVAEIEQEIAKSQANRVTGSGSSVSSQSSGQSRELPSAALPSGLPAVGADQKPRVAEFGPGLGRAVTNSVDEEFEAPPDSVLDKVQLFFNNLAPSNVEQKANELRDMLDRRYFGWLGHFLVVKRISTQANFHSLYLSFLDCLGDYGKGLVKAIVSSVYHSIGKLLRSPKITTSTSERGYLKNLGIWLGQITLARNRPILQLMLDCKELLLQGYETGKLIAVAPFLAKTLEGAKNSVVFRPRNPWLMGILGVFRSVYNVQGLKMNIKFEVEVLCKNLGVKLEDIPLRNDVLARRIAPVKERNPDFNIKSSAPQKSAAETLGLPAASKDGTKATSTQEQHDTVIPNLASYVTINQSLPQLLQTQGGGALASINANALKRYVPLAVDRAIREISQPVVERSVTIASITTKEIVTKDFAMESDEKKMRKAGQLMVANLAGSLALVTCREPLRSSISSHLRQLLTNSLGRSEKLGEQEQNAIEQCVQICSTENLELGCRLIEKAATEKSVRGVEEALAASMNARRTHREQTGQPFFDTSIFSTNQRYPAALPDELRPKPGGLRAEHYQLYESFQRLPRQTSSSVGGGAGVAPRAPGASGANEESDVGSTSKQMFNTKILSSIAAKVDSMVTALLTAAGTRAAEIKMAMLAPDHQIKQLLAAVKQAMPNASPSGSVARALTAQEQELVLGFSQGIFKRLYELSLSEPLRLEVLVELLEAVNTYCPKLGKDMGTWATYAPTNTEAQRRLHKTVLLLLVRSRLLSVQDLDSFLAARADHGRNHIWVEFSLLFIRTAFHELIAAPSDFPKLMELMTRIAEGRSQASPQILEAYRKPIVRMLEDARSVSGGSKHSPTIVGGQPSTDAILSIEDSSSLSKASLGKLMRASQSICEATEARANKDPENIHQQITTLLDAWIRIQSEGQGNEKAAAEFLSVLQQFGLGKSEEQTERFLRVSTLVVVEAVLNSAASTGNMKPALNYTFIDMYAKLTQTIFRGMNSGGTQDQVDAQRLGMLNRILGVIVRTMVWHSEKWKAEKRPTAWDQRPWYRLLLNLLVDLNKPDPTLESCRLAMLSVFGVALHACQPLVLPGFSFAWLGLVSHRHFMPNLLLYPGQKAWHIMHELLVDVFLFLEPYLKAIQLTAGVKKFYEGTLRVLLVLLHDFPSFLAGYHLSLCNVIPDTCVQLRNIIISATPKGMSPPDPFTPNLKIDLLPEISRSPLILSNALGPIESIRSHLDAYLKEGQRDMLSRLPQLLFGKGSVVDAQKVNSLVLYAGVHALTRMQNSQISLSRTPEIELFQALMELDDHSRYISLNAFANQLRFPSSHTHYFSCVMLYLFSEAKNVAVKEQVTRVLLERLIVNRPHPWGLLITFIELIKNQRYSFWSYPFTRCATEIEKVFESVARSCMPPASQQSTLVGADEN